MSGNDQNDDPHSLTDKSDAELYQMIYETQQLPDAFWAGRAEAEIKKRDRHHQNKLVGKQVLVAKFSMFAAVGSAIVAILLLGVELKPIFGG